MKSSRFTVVNVCFQFIAILYLCSTVIAQDGDGTASPGVSAFWLPAHYGAGDGPVSVAIGDLNGDDDRDLAVANHDSDEVSVLVGNGDGTFQPAVNYGAGDGPYSVAVVDLDGDDSPDLAVANRNSDEVSVLLGNGDGTFQPAVDCGAGDEPRSVAAVDLDGDDVPDLAVANYGSRDVSVLLGIGDGTFQAAVNYGGSDKPHNEIAVADLNGDDNLDLVVANGDHGTSLLPLEVSVLLGNGDGTFQPPLPPATALGPSVAIGDLNGDDNLDLVGGHFFHHIYEGSGILVWLGNGDGTFSFGSLIEIAGDPVSVTIAELVGDGAPDLAIALSVTDSVLVLSGIGDGTFSLVPPSVTVVVGDNPSSVTAGDLNGDDNLDLAVANRGSDNVSVLMNQPPFWGTPASVLGTQHESSSTSLPYIFLVAIPVGVVLFWKRLGRRR